MATDFHLVPYRLPEVISVLEAAPEFAASPERAGLDGHGEDLPGVVAAAYARFLSRKVAGLTDQGLARLILPLSNLAAWRDGPVDRLLEDEVFEMLDAPVARRLQPLMGEPLRDLYSAWAQRRQ